MQKTILVVEDYPDTRSFMKFVLEDYGYEVWEAENGEKAVESVKAHVPDLILMDMSMPVMDGLTATRIIRGLESSKDVPIFAVTAFGTAYSKNAIEAGCNALIAKPVDIDKLETLLQQYLSGY